MQTFAQLTVDNSLTAAELINDILLGEGVEAENITINGQAANAVNIQFGSFNAENSNIGIDRGVILATGGITVAESPNDMPTAYVSVPEDDQLTTEPDLAQIIAPAGLYDVASVEFDFTAQGDTLRFNYVFASEEYNEHTCSSYNDVFGFFISGPGISGNPNYQNNARNVATVPGTNTPVAINTVNQGFAGAYGSNAVCNAVSTNWQSNSSYFVDNESNMSQSATQFDGFTVPFKVEVPVICGETYHIKLSIADAIDDKNDSAVFFEAGSFSSEAPLMAEVETLNSDVEGNAVEGCSSLRIVLNRPDSALSKTIYFETEGLENREAIIPGLPDSIVFAAQDGHRVLNFDIESDFTYQGLRNFSLNILQPAVCSMDTAVLSLPIDIIDFGEMVLDYPDTIALDCIESAMIDIGVSGGRTPYQITWTDPEINGFSPEIDIEDSTAIVGTVTDQCNIHEETVEVFIYRESYDDLSVSAPSAIAFNCYEEVFIEPIVSGGFGDYAYQWIQAGSVISEASALNQIIELDGNIELVVSDRCAPDVQRTIETNQSVNPITVNLGTDTTGVCTDLLTVVPEVSGGFGELQFQWKLNDNAVSSIASYSFYPQQTSAVKLKVNDVCGQEAEDDLMVMVEHIPMVTSLPEDTAICPRERLILDPKATGGTGELRYFWNETEIPSGVYSTMPGFDTSYFLRIEDECGKEITRQINIDVREVIANFEFNYDSTPIKIENSSSPNCLYEWSFPDGSNSSEFEPVIAQESLQDGQTTLFVMNDIGCIAEARNPFEPPFELFLPNAFTPDGDGVNDIFKAEGIFVKTFELRVFDRWGNLVFQSNSLDEGWDGSDPQIGSSYAVDNEMYTYTYRAESVNGRLTSGNGRVVVIR